MRQIQYLSPTSISKWEESQEEFYLQYLADDRPPRFPQTQPMSIGSAFDAYVKSYLHEGLFGKGQDPKYGFEALFEAQVETQNRDWARQHGKYAFDCYNQAGSLIGLMTELQRADGDPRFEFEVRGAVHGYREGNTATIANVTFLGKPDVTFTNSAGAHVILDFKVNGYCSIASPMKGYLRLRSPGNTHHGMHKAATPMMVHGMEINVGHRLEDLNNDWARQLAIYAWLCGEPVGSEFIVAIDQLACNSKKSMLPQIRIAEHRLLISREYQQRIFDKGCEIWDIVHSDHIFRDMTLEESQDRCQYLDSYNQVLKGEGTSEDNWFASVCRGV